MAVMLKVVKSWRGAEEAQSKRFTEILDSLLVGEEVRRLHITSECTAAAAEWCRLLCCAEYLLLRFENSSARPLPITSKL